MICLSKATSLLLFRGDKSLSGVTLLCHSFWQYSNANAPIYFYSFKKICYEKITIASRKEPEVQLWKKQKLSKLHRNVWEGKYSSFRMIQQGLFGGVCFEVGIRKGQQLLVPVFWLLSCAQFFPALSKPISSQWKPQGFPQSGFLHFMVTTEEGSMGIQSQAFYK